jgi:hypothetical protein
VLASCLGQKAANTTAFRNHLRTRRRLPPTATLIVDGPEIRTLKIVHDQRETAVHDHPEIAVHDALKSPSTMP